MHSIKVEIYTFLNCEPGGCGHFKCKTNWLPGDLNWNTVTARGRLGVFAVFNQSPVQNGGYPTQAIVIIFMHGVVTSLIRVLRIIQARRHWPFWWLVWSRKQININSCHPFLIYNLSLILITIPAREASRLLDSIFAYWNILLSPLAPRL